MNHMKFIQFSIFFILTTLAISLCGCNEPIQQGQVTGRTDLFRLVEYNITTIATNPLGTEKELGNGFIHQADSIRFEIKGTVQNIGDNETDLDIFLYYYDSNDNVLESRKFNINNLKVEEIRGFYDAVVLNTHDYFYDVEKISFEFLED